MKTYNQFLENKKTDFFLSKAVQAIEYNGQTVESFTVDFCESHCLNENSWDDYKGFWKSLPGRISGAIGRMNLPPHQSGIESLKSALNKLGSVKGLKKEFIDRLKKLIDDMEAELYPSDQYSALGKTTASAEEKPAPTSPWSKGLENIKAQQTAELARKEAEARSKRTIPGPGSGML